MAKRQCYLCGKEIKGLKSLIHLKKFDKELCGDCYGYVCLYCRKPEDLERYTIEDLKAIHNKNVCDLCGKKANSLQKKYLKDGMICGDCVKLLRPYYKKEKKDASEGAGAVATTVVTGAVEFLLDAPGAFGTTPAEDPMDKASIEELRELYQKVKE